MGRAVTAVAMVLALGCAEQATRSRTVASHAAALGPSSAPEPQPEAEGQANPWLETVESIAVAGASASAGFGTSVPLFEALDYALRVPHEVDDVSTSTHFMSPVPLGRMQVGVLQNKEPSVVVAVDFLFWFAHGVKSTAQRRADLAEGLRLLETLDCPVFVGDLPNVHGAATRMISPAQIPSVQLLAELNATIEAWADAHPQVHRLPMAAWMDALRSGAPVSVAGTMRTLAPDEVLQPDRLHPSTRGQAVLAMLVLAEVARVVGGARPGDVVTDPDALQATLQREAKPVAAKPAEAHARPPKDRADRRDSGPPPAGG